MIYLFPDMKPEDLKKANDAYLVHFLCSAMRHPPATVVGDNHIECLCQGWKRPLIRPAGDGVASSVTVDALKQELDTYKAYARALRGALARAIEALAADGIQLGLASDLTEVLEGRAVE